MRRGPVGVPVAKLAEAARPTAVGNWPAFIEVSADTTVTADAVAHTVGAWAPVIATTAAPANWMLVTISGMTQTTTDTRGLVDIGTGAAAAETVVVSSLPAGFSHSISAAGGSTGLGNPLWAWLPVDIPKGTRVAARLRALVTVDTAVVSVALFNTPLGRSPSKLDTIGAVTASSRGTNMPSNDTYVELTAATAQAYQALILLPCGGSATVYGTATVTYTMAIGASGAEVAVATSRVTTDTSERILQYPSSAAPNIAVGHFPRGTRVACKQSTGVAYRDAIVIGVPYA
jgi:hypothetical protein